MKKLIKPSEIEWVIDKSRFLGHCIPITSADEIDGHIKAMRRNHHKANHVCSAWRIGLEQPSGHFSDDGEPSQTAGLPMFQYLEHQDVTDVLVLAVRYFGGIKLGTGGLVRAYTETARQAVEAAQWMDVLPRLKVQTRYAYTFQKVVMLEMQQELQAAPEYAAAITQVFYVEDHQPIDQLNDKLNGQLDILHSEPVFVGIGATGIVELGGKHETTD